MLFSALSFPVTSAQIRLLKPAFTAGGSTVVLRQTLHAAEFSTPCARTALPPAQALPGAVPAGGAPRAVAHG